MTDDDIIEEPRRKRRGLLWLTLGVVTVSAGGAGAWWYWDRDSTGDAPPVATGPSSTTEVTRSSISDTETWEGTLNHGESFTVSALTGQGPSVLTRAAELDSEVTRGTLLYHVNEQPVTALYGAVPMYRDLGSGDTGTDVKQLESNLSKLGYDGGYGDAFTVDDEYDWYTEQAVLEWQEDIGVEETGSVSRGSVVFVPGNGRVDSAYAVTGQTVTSGAPILGVTGQDQMVTFDVEVPDRELFETDAGVTVALPDGDEVTGTVSAATVVPDDEPADGGGNEQQEETGADAAIVEVELALKDQVDESLLGSPVDVVVKVDEREDVLVVPVNALIALSEGGYGLEVVTADGATSSVPVEAGLFADGKVEVEGAGIDEGTVVAVAAR